MRATATRRLWGKRLARLTFFIPRTVEYVKDAWRYDRGDCIAAGVCCAGVLAIITFFVHLHYVSQPVDEATLVRISKDECLMKRVAVHARHTMITRAIVGQAEDDCEVSRTLQQQLDFINRQ